MASLQLRARHRPPEVREEASPTGWVQVERAPQRAILLTPDAIDPGRLYPLVTVLHGAGRGDERLALAYRDEAERRQSLFLIPRSRHATWDLIAAGAHGRIPEPAAGEAASTRPDLDFLEYAFQLVYRRYPVDPDRQALLGYSDGASYALSVGLSNPAIFRAVMGWAAGFVALGAVPAAAPKPVILLEHGTADDVFPFERVARPLREHLEHLGYRVTFRVDEAGRHWPSGDFQPEALDWFFSDPWEPRS